MKVCILMGSQRPAGNTATLLRPFKEELLRLGAEVDSFSLYRETIGPCMGCRRCRETPDDLGCIVRDDGEKLIRSMLRSDRVVFATPVYCCFCTAPMKALLDRLFCVFKEGRTLWSNQQIGLLATCGDDAETGPLLFEQALRYLCDSAELPWLGVCAVQEKDGLSDFTSPDAVQSARMFARCVYEGVKQYG